MTARDGIVDFQGPIRREEKDRLVFAVRSVPGVQEVVDRLEAHDAAEGVPALQGRTEPDEALSIRRMRYEPGDVLQHGRQELAGGG